MISKQACTNPYFMRWLQERMRFQTPKPAPKKEDKPHIPGWSSSTK